MSLRLKKNSSRSGRVRKRGRSSQKKGSSPHRQNSPIVIKSSKKLDPVRERRKMCRQMIGIAIITVLMVGFTVGTEYLMGAAPTLPSDRINRTVMTYRGGVVVTSNLDCSIVTRSCVMRKDVRLPECTVIAFVCLSHMRDDVINEEHDATYAYVEECVTDEEGDRYGTVSEHRDVRGLTTNKVLNFGQRICELRSLKWKQNYNVHSYYMRNVSKRFVASHENLHPRGMTVEKQRQLAHGRVVSLSDKQFMRSVADPVKKIFNGRSSSTKPIPTNTIDIGGVEVSCASSSGCKLVLAILRTAYEVMKLRVADSATGKDNEEGLVKETWAAAAVYASTQTVLLRAVEKNVSNVLDIPANEATFRKGAKMPILTGDVRNVNILISERDQMKSQTTDWEIVTIASLTTTLNEDTDLGIGEVLMPSFRTVSNNSATLPVDFAVHLIVKNHTEITIIMVDAQTVDRLVEGLAMTALRMIYYGDSLEELAQRPRHFFYSFVNRQCEKVNIKLEQISKFVPEIDECHDVSESSSRSLTIVRHVPTNEYQVIKEEDDNYNYVVGF